MKKSGKKGKLVKLVEEMGVMLRKTSSSGRVLIGKQLGLSISGKKGR